MIIAALVDAHEEGRRGHEEADGRPARRHGPARLLGSSASGVRLLDGPSRIAPGARRRAPAPARHRRQERAAPRVPPPQEPARARRSPDRGDRHGQGSRGALLGVPQHHRQRSVQLLHQRRPRPGPDLRGRGSAERLGGREDALQGHVSRADGRAVAAAGHRPRRSEDPEPADAGGAGRTSRRSSSRRTPPSKAKRRRSTSRS